MSDPTKTGAIEGADAPPTSAQEDLSAVARRLLSPPPGKDEASKIARRLLEGSAGGGQKKASSEDNSDVVTPDAKRGERDKLDVSYFGLAYPPFL